MIELDVQAMSCGHCVAAVTQAVRSVDAAARVDVDLAAHRVSVETTQPREKIVAALVEAGYAPD